MQHSIPALGLVKALKDDHTEVVCKYTDLDYLSIYSNQTTHSGKPVQTELSRLLWEEFRSAAINV